MNEVVQRPRESAKRPMDAQKEEHDERAGRKPERTVDDALNETKSSEHGARYPESSMLARDPAARETRPRWEARATPLTRTVCRATFDVQVPNLSPPFLHLRFLRFYVSASLISFFLSHLSLKLPLNLWPPCPPQLAVVASEPSPSWSFPSPPNRHSMPSIVTLKRVALAGSTRDLCRWLRNREPLL